MTVIIWPSNRGLAMTFAEQVTQQRELEGKLEALIDAHGVREILIAVGNVCGDKATHLAEAWQDTSSAKVWERRQGKLHDIATTILFAE